jgi:hypothetical protein
MLLHGFNIYEAIAVISLGWKSPDDLRNPKWEFPKMQKKVW